MNLSCHLISGQARSCPRFFQPMLLLATNKPLFNTKFYRKPLRRKAPSL